MRGTLLFTTSMFVVGASGWLLYDPSAPATAARPAPASPTALASPEPRLQARAPAVMVIVVRAPGGLDALREQLPRNRVLLTRRNAIAMADGRIFARGVEAASEPISELGWADRPLEIVDAAQVRARAGRASGRAGAAGAPARSEPDTLSLDEASALLQDLMNQP